MAGTDFDDLLAEAVAAPFAGWDFSWIADRQSLDPLPWDYRAIVEAAASHAETMLDMGTGGGEFLSSLDRVPRLTIATEGYRPNWPVAARRPGYSSAAPLAPRRRCR